MRAAAGCLAVVLLLSCGDPPRPPAPAPEPGTPAALLHEFCSAMLRGDGEAALACVVDSQEGACARVLPVAAQLTRLAREGAGGVTLHPIADPSHYRNIRTMGLQQAVEGDELALPPGIERPCTLVRRDGRWLFDMSGSFPDPEALAAVLRAQSANIRSRVASSSR